MKNEMVYQVPEQEKSISLVRTVFNKPKEGIECMFVQLTPEVGIKVYPTKRTAQFSHNRQAKAAKHHIAPKVLSRVKKCLVANLIQYDEEDIFESESDHTSHKKYGYFFKTQVAECPVRYSDTHAMKLEEKLDELGMDGGDLHEGNIGKINGHLVVIDFGKESVS